MKFIDSNPGFPISSAVIHSGKTFEAVVTGIPDASKGEALVLLTTREVAMADVRARLLEAGFPNLWVPKLIVKVDAIPILGTGKTDLKGCRTIAIERAAALSEA